MNSNCVSSFWFLTEHGVVDSRELDGFESILLGAFGVVLLHGDASTYDIARELSSLGIEISGASATDS